MFTETTTTITAASTRFRSLGLGLIVAAIALLSFFGRTGDAKAGFAWCADDPIITVNGQDIQVWVNVPSDNLSQVQNARVEFHVPGNVNPKIVLVDQTFFPETVVIVKDLPNWSGKDGLVLQVKIQIDTNGDGSAFPIAAQVIDAVGANWYEGSSDAALSFMAVAKERRASRTPRLPQFAPLGTVCPLPAGGD